MTLMATMMDVPLTIDLVVDRAAKWMGDVEVVSRRADKSIARTTYGTVIERAKRLARALIGAGIKPGDRVATLMWNHAEHLEAYFGIPLAGAVLHTLNLRLSVEDVAFIANDAGDRFLIVDESLTVMCDKLQAAGGKFEKIIVVGPNGDYEAFLDTAKADTALPKLAESDALGVCYTSGTTGKPKGVVYSHRSTVLHAIVEALPDSLNLSRADTLLPVVPMFHVNAWGLPFACALVGAKLVFPGPHLDPPSLLDLFASEKVTIGAGVPTIWIGIREALDANPGKWKLQPDVTMVIGGAAAPEQLIRDFDRLGLRLLHAWGMTETSPIGLVSRIPPHLKDADEKTRYKLRAKQGVPPPLVDVIVRNDAGDVPPDDRTSGELMVRGPWIAGAYKGGATPERWTSDGWFRTGDVAKVDAHGFVQLTDRVADLIKSGGEWIASQEIENVLMGHPSVKEAAVVGVPHPKWSERPIAIVVLRPGLEATSEELKAYVGERFPKYWIPDAVVFSEAIPRTSAGKFKKTELRETHRNFFT
ncbi:MAG: long-chain fatty acid--CoA ligase [Kofleriaceae bacterium]